MEVTIRPTPKQEQAWSILRNDSTKYLLFGGGAGGGKSWLIAEWLMTNCYFHPKSRWFIGREELKKIMNSFYVTWHKVCIYHSIPRDDWSYNGQYNYIEFTNGSRIDFLDLKKNPSDPMFERFGSLEYTGGAIEEAGEVDQLAFDVLKSRINRHMNKEFNVTGKILLTANPTKNWLYKEFYKPFITKTLPGSHAFIQSLYQDNPYTSISYGESLKDIKNEAMKQRLMFGNWEYDSDDTKLIEYDAIRDMFSTKLEPSKKKVLTIDIARFGKDKAVIMYWEGFIVKKIYSYDRSGLDFLEDKTKELCNTLVIPRSSVIADEDGVGGGFIDHFKCKGFIGGSSPIPTIKEPKPNYRNLRTQCYYMLADKINNRQLAIEDGKYQEEIVEELEQIKEKNIDKDSKLAIIGKDEIKAQIGKSPDFADTLMMRFKLELTGGVFEPYKKTFKIQYDYMGRPFAK